MNNQSNMNNFNMKKLTDMLASKQGQEFLNKLRYADKQTLNNMMNEAKRNLGEEAMRNIAQSPQIKNMANNQELFNALKKLLKE